MTLTTGGDKVRLYEDQVAVLNRLEQLQNDRFRRGDVQQMDVHIVKYYRLEAEQALAQAKAENGESPRNAQSKE